MCHNLRYNTRIDYKLLSTTGTRKLINPSTDMSGDYSTLRAELDGFLFQLDEIVDDYDDECVSMYDSLTKSHDELKELRISIVKLHSQVTALKVDDEFTKTVNQKLKAGKTILAKLKNSITSLPFHSD